MALGYIVRFHDRTSPSWATSDVKETLLQEGDHGRVKTALYTFSSSRAQKETALATFSREEIRIIGVIGRIVYRARKNNTMSDVDVASLLDTCTRICALVYVNLSGWSDPEEVLVPAIVPTPHGGLEARAAVSLPEPEQPKDLSTTTLAGSGSRR